MFLIVLQLEKQSKSVSIDNSRLSDTMFKKRSPKMEEPRKKKTIEVCYSNTIAINKGNYENEKPFYSGKTVLEVEDDPNAIEMAYRAHFEQLKGIVEPLIQADYNKKRTDLANVRIRVKDGKKYPSVTSILNPDGISTKIKNLDKYIIRGNNADEAFKAVMTGTRIPEIDESKFAPLTWDWDIKAFIKEHKLLKTLEIPLWTANVEVFNEEYQYSGEIDLLKEDCLIVDIKTGAWKWEQQIAYAKCKPSVKKIAIADLKENKYTEVGINEPLICKAWEKFIYKRGVFFSRFGL